MKTQHTIAFETAATLHVTTHWEAAKLHELVSNLWSESDASWRNGDSRFTRDIVNSLATLAHACSVKAQQLKPVDTSDVARMSQFDGGIE